MGRRCNPDNVLSIDRMAERGGACCSVRPGRRPPARRRGRVGDFVCLATGVEAGCLCIMDGIAPGGGPIDRGIGCVRSWSRLKVRICPRLKHVVAVIMVVTMRGFPSEGAARETDRQSDRSDKAFDHGSMS